MTCTKHPRIILQFYMLLFDIDLGNAIDLWYFRDIVLSALSSILARLASQIIKAI